MAVWEGRTISRDASSKSSLRQVRSQADLSARKGEQDRVVPVLDEERGAFATRDSYPHARLL